MSDFGERLVEYRKRLGMTQRALAERAGLAPSHLNPIEKGTRKPPSVESVLRMIEALRLTRGEAVELLRLASYSPLVLDETHLGMTDRGELKGLQGGDTQCHMNNGRLAKGQLDAPSYPPIPRAKVVERLWANYPTAQLQPDATVADTNLLALWLWNSPLDERIHKYDLLGASVFEVFTRLWNFERIALPEKPYHFWWIKILIFRLFEKNLDAVIAENFRKAIFKEPLLQVIYMSGDIIEVGVGKGWYNYCLKIRPPQASTIDEYLEFLVTVEITRKSDDSLESFLVSYHPTNDYTRERVNTEYERLIAQHHAGSFVQRQHYDRANHFPVSFPAFTQDMYWTITSVNAAFQKMLDGLAYSWGDEPITAIGMNYLELLFLPSERKPVEAIYEWETAVIHAMASYQSMMRREVEKHPEASAMFEATIERLAKKLGAEFSDLYKRAELTSVRYAVTCGEPFYA